MIGVDAIEDGVRARVRGFIETMLEEELDGGLVAPALWTAQAAAMAISRRRSSAAGMAIANGR